MAARQIWWATGLGLVALLFALAFWDPATAGGPDLCLVHRATGVACPACGLTRAAAAFARGELALSLRWHPLFLLLAGESALFWLAWGLALGERPGAGHSRVAALRRFAPRLAIGNGILLLAVWIVRFATGTLPV
jgi:hypothetical protein